MVNKFTLKAYFWKGASILNELSAALLWSLPTILSFSLTTSVKWFNRVSTLLKRDSIEIRETLVYPKFHTVRHQQTAMVYSTLGPNKDTLNSTLILTMPLVLPLLFNARVWCILNFFTVMWKHPETTMYSNMDICKSVANQAHLWMIEIGKCWWLWKSGQVEIEILTCTYVTALSVASPFHKEVRADIIL